MIGRHKGRIIMICQAYTDSRADLEDCFQEVAARIWEGYANFRGDAAEATWIYRVTLNCAINFSRKIQAEAADRGFARPRHDRGSII